MYGYNDPVNANDPDGAQAVRSSLRKELEDRNHNGLMMASMDPGGRYAMMLPERLAAQREATYQAGWNMLMSIKASFDNTEFGGVWNSSSPGSVTAFGSKGSAITHVTHMKNSGLPSFSTFVNRDLVLYEPGNFLFEWDNETGEKFFIGTNIQVTAEDLANSRDKNYVKSVDEAQNGGTLHAGLSDDLLTSAQLGLAGLKPSFDAAAYDAFKNGGKGSVPFHLKKSITASYKSVNNNAIRLGKVSASFAKNGAAVMRVAAPALTGAAFVTNGISIVSDGELTWGDAFVGINTGLQVAFPVYGVLYGAVDVGASLVTGTSLTDYTRNAIDSNTNGSIKLF
jgi:hypothetical protein